LNEPTRSNQRPPDGDPMRVVILAFTVILVIAAAMLRFWPIDFRTNDSGGSTGSLAKVISDGVARLALVMAAIWIAWPVARKPAMWLPPGLAVLALLVLGVCIVQPRAAVMLLPALGLLLTIGAALKFIRGK
jgi:hypothetical protein